MKNFHSQKNNFKNGFTLVETLVAISIFTLAVVALMSVLASGVSDTTYVKKKLTAEYLAQEGIEYMRNVRDNYVLYSSTAQAGWNNFNAFTCTVASPCGYNSTTYPGYLCSSSGHTCELYTSNGKYDADPTLGADSGYLRQFIVTPISANESKITSVVSWTQGSGAYNVSFSEDLYNWVQ